jgi:hypothetical protein
MSGAESTIVHFQTIEEVEGLRGFRRNNPLTIESYSRIRGWYHFPQKHRCCVERPSGELCRTEHNKGWVTEKKDGSLTIIGQDCANDKFGADPTVFKDLVLARNAIQAKLQAERLGVLLQRRDEFEAHLAKAATDVKAIRKRVDNFLAECGEKLRRKLTNMARTGNAVVAVDGIRLRPFEEQGRSKTERSVIKHQLGSVDGLAVIPKEPFIRLSVSIEHVRAALRGANELETLSRRTVAALSVRLEQCDPLLRQVAEISILADKFFATQRLLFCFLTDDRGDRSKFARLAMREGGIDGGRDSAKEWIKEFEQTLSKELGVERIELAV